MKIPQLPTPQLLQVYLDALFQLATGFKPVLSSGAISAFVQGRRTSMKKPKQNLVEWCAHNPTQVWDYEPLNPTDIQRLTTLLNGTARILNKAMPDLKAVEVSDKSTLSPQDQADRIQAIFQRAGISPERAQAFAAGRKPQTIEHPLDS